MFYDQHPELQSKWDNAYWARRYHIVKDGNITDEAVQKYIKEQAEESKKTKEALFYKRVSNGACDTALWGEQ